MIPDEALDDRLGIVGTSGSGKTYTAGAAVERVLARGHRVVIVDPLDVWWGLRLMADGVTPSPHKIAIFGGWHGDLPLNEHAGAIIGETVATMPESCIVSLGDLGTKASQRRFMLAFLEQLYRKTDPKRQDPYHVIFDEADLWAPQQSPEPKLQSRMEEIVRRGRIRGFVPWLITQRPAVLSKDVLSQVDGLVAMKLTASQDRDAIGKWILGQADKDDGKRILAELPTMKRGQGVLWVPARGILETTDFPAKETFDSSRTPARGERVMSTPLPPVDLDAVRARLVSVRKDVDANDPAKLRAEIDRLSRELAEAKKDDGREIYEHGARFGWKQAVLAIGALVPKLITSTVEEIGKQGCPTIPKDWGKSPLEAAQDVLTADHVLAEFERRHPEPQTQHPNHPDPARRPPPPAPRRPSGPVDSSMGGGLRRLLTALAQRPQGLTVRQLAMRTGYSSAGGGFRNYLSKARTSGWIEGGSTITITDTGLGALGEFEPLPRGPELVEHWVQNLDGGPAKILRVLVEAWPAYLEVPDIADRTGYQPTGGGFRNYLSRLRTLELVEGGRGSLRASPEFFE